jgi:hypothetical protein
MTAIDVQNTDWTIVAGVRAALEAATIDSEPVFESVGVSTSDEQVRQCHLARSPGAIVRYLTTREFASPGGLVGSALAMELILSVRIDRAGIDEGARLQEVLRLVNAAKNAVGASPPAPARDWVDGASPAPAIEFGSPEIDTAEGRPWALARLPVSFTYVLANPTAH